MPSVRLHIICGGGTGSRLLRALHDLGYGLSAGPLSEIDEDAQTARGVGAEVAMVSRIGTVGEKPLRQAKELLLRADGTILTPFAVGKGNLASLTLALDLPAGRPLFLVLGGDFATRDYTGGEATRVYARLRERAIAQPRSVSELLPILAERLPVG